MASMLVTGRSEDSLWKALLDAMRKYRLNDDNMFAVHFAAAAPNGNGKGSVSSTATTPTSKTTTVTTTVATETTATITTTRIPTTR